MCPLSTQRTKVLIRVRDNGIGIAADQLTSIFDLYTQADTRRSTGGLGIGLALVKRLAATHGGDIEVRSAGLNQGSEFIVHLPAA